MLIPCKSFSIITNSLPVFTARDVTEPFYAKVKSKFIKLTKTAPGTNSINTTAVANTKAPFKPRVIRDLDGDGNLDALTQTGKVIFISYGPNFETTTNLSVPLSSKGFKLVATGDINGDSQMDLILQKGKKATAYLANAGTYEQVQLNFSSSLAPRSKIIGVLDPFAHHEQIQTSDIFALDGGGTDEIINTVATPIYNPSLVVKTGKELFFYTNNNGFFFPTQLPFYTLQPKEKVVGTFSTGITPLSIAVSIKTVIDDQTPLEPGEDPQNISTIISNAVYIPDIVIQRKREILALSRLNNFSSPFLVASNRAGVKIIGPK
jgi:hypothetical protein